MIKYFCDHCGEEIKAMDSLREIEYGWSPLGCAKNTWKGALHKECLNSLNIHLMSFVEAGGNKLAVDK